MVGGEIEREGGSSSYDQPWNIILVALDNGFVSVPKCKEDESTREGMDIISLTSWYYDGR